jgi:hypothetical protein
MRRYQLIPSTAFQTLKITSSASLPVGEVGVSYALTFNAIGGVAPYTWSAVSPPGGLSLSAAGTLSGIPTTAASTIFNVTVTDTAGSHFVLTCSITILAAVILTGETLPTATNGVFYTQDISGQASLGLPPYTFSVVSATGSDLWTVTSAGVINGVPGAANERITNTGDYRVTNTGDYRVTN